MIVLDASAAAELLLDTDIGTAVGQRLARETLHAPAHFDAEVVGVVRRSVQRGLLTERDGLIALGDFSRLPIRRWLAAPMIERAYALRSTHTVADALYLVLARALGGPLLTCDERLARSHGHGARIETP